MLSSMQVSVYFNVFQQLNEWQWEWSRRLSSVMHWNGKQLKHKTHLRAPCADTVAIMISLCGRWKLLAVTRLYLEAASLQKVHRLHPWISEQQRCLEWGGWWRSSPWELQREAKLPKSRTGRSEPSLSSEQTTCTLLWNETFKMWHKF